MKKYFLILIFGFGPLSFQANAQCCAPPSNIKTIVENSNQENGKTVKLKIIGLTCTGCANHVSTALKEVDGIFKQNVESLGDLAIIQYDPSKTNPEAIIKVIEQIGYKARIDKEEINGKK